MSFLFFICMRLHTDNNQSDTKCSDAQHETSLSLLPRLSLMEINAVSVNSRPTESIRTLSRPAGASHSWQCRKKQNKSG